MSTQTVWLTPLWRSLWSALVFAGGLSVAAPGLSGAANAQAAASGVGPGDMAKQQSSSERLDPAIVDDVDYELLLGRLLSNRKSRLLLADLEVLIRRGNSQEASGFLKDALEVGTVAALLMKRVESPGLLAFLQTLDKPQASAGTIAGAASAENKMAENRCEELEKARTELTASADREKARAEAASAALDGERSALAASEAKLTEVQDALERERSRAEQATAALEVSHREIEKLRGGAEQAGSLSDALAREKERADAAAQELGRLKNEQFAALRQSESKLAEANASVEKERRRVEAAASEIGVLKSERSKLLARVAELEPAVQREKQRADGGAEQAGRLSDALAREKGRADAAAQELGGLRDELAALRKGESRLGEISTARRERTSAARLRSPTWRC